MKFGPLDLTRDNVIPWLRLGAEELRTLARERIGGRQCRELRLLEYVLANTPAGDAEAVLDAIDKFAREDSFLMNVGDEKGLILDRAVRDSGAGAALELGAFCGYSAIRIARLLRRPGSRLVSIELSPMRANVAERMVEHAGMKSRVSFLRGSSTEKIVALQQQFELVFIDHAKELYLQDLRALEEHDLLKPGAIIVADNVGMFASMDEYMDHTRRSGLYSSVHHKTRLEYDRGISDIVEVSTFLAKKER